MEFKNKEVLKELSNITNLSKEDMEAKFLESNDLNELSVGEIEIGLKNMNPNLAKLLIVETLQSERIQKKYGAFPTSTVHHIKELLNSTHEDLNKIEDPVNRLEAMSLELVENKLSEQFEYCEGLDQSAFIKKAIDKKMQSFNLLPDYLQVGVKPDLNEINSPKRKI